MTGVNKTLTPINVLADYPTHQSNRVIWGGIIVNIQNLEQNTLLEILAYPLGFDNEPDTEKTPIGRFVVEFPDYLGTMKYVNGQLITIAGPLLEIRKGTIGKARFNYPVITAEQLHLWPKPDYEPDPQIYFGIGINITH